MERFNPLGDRPAMGPPDLGPIGRHPQRISITLSWALHERLVKRSVQEGRSLSNLAAFLLEASCPD